MSRIRSIHPGIFTDEAFMTLTVECPMAIPLLLGLWTEADDAGAFEWKPLTIKARILPAAAANVGDLLATLISAGFVMAYEVDGKRFGSIRNFVRYQRPKDPKDVHPFTAESRVYAGFNSDGTRPNATTGRKSFVTTSEQLPKSPETGSEISALMKEEGGRREEEKKEDSLSEASSDAPLLELTGEPVEPKKKNRTKIDYPPDFEAFWVVYPTDDNMSKSEALKVWKKLDDDDRMKAQASLTGFVAYCRKNRDYRPIHAEGYLKKRRFDGFAQSAPCGGTTTEAVTDDRWRTLLGLFADTGVWHWRALSPEPGKPGCRVPAEILAEFSDRLRRVMPPAELMGAAE